MSAPTQPSRDHHRNAIERAVHWAETAEVSHQEAERYLDQIQESGDHEERDGLWDLVNQQRLYRQLDIDMALMWSAVAAAANGTRIPMEEAPDD